MTLGRATAVLLWIAFLKDIRAQNVPEWQVKAGGKASFEVASVKPFKPSKDTIPRPPKMNLANGDGKPAGGRFYSQFFGVLAYIGFAYKLAPGEGGKLSIICRSGRGRLRSRLRRTHPATRRRTRCA